MTEISRPWTGTTLGDSGPYSADQWAQIYRSAFGNGAADSDSGPIMGSGAAPDPGLTVSATGPASASVNVSAGAALVHGTFYIDDATVNLAIASNVSGNPRIDTIILRKDWTSQTVRLTVLQGTPNATPVATNLTQTDGVLWEVPLADIAVASGFSSLAQSTITPRRVWANVADGVYLNDILNNTAGILVAGDVVVRDATADRAAKTTTTLNDATVFGIWMARTAAGGYGRLVQRGIAYVNLTAAATRGDLVVVSATAKKADVVASGAAATQSRARIIGVALETTSGAGLCLCSIEINISRPLASKAIVRDNGGDYATASATFVDLDATNLVITLIIENPNVLLTFTGVTWDFNRQGAYDFLVDGVRVGAAALNGLMTANGGNGDYNGSMVYLATGLAPGSHTFKVQHMAITSTSTVRAGNNVAGTDFVVTFCAQEMP